MYFLETIEGARGELLTSALLKYALLNSSRFRAEFLKLIGGNFADSQAPSFKDGVICYAEYTIDSKAADGEADDRRGFIDLLVVGDNTVLGIENKLWADFTPGQPKKYLDTLQRIASETRQGSQQMQWRLVVIAPEDRRNDIESHLKEQGIQKSDSIILDWEDVGEALQVCADESTSVDEAYLDMFIEYLQTQLADTNINIASEKIVGRGFARTDTVFHQDFLYKVRRLFHAPGRIVGARDSGQFYGFSFGLNGADIEARQRPWFGFWKEGDEVELVCQTLISDEAALAKAKFPIRSDSKPNDRWLSIDYDPKRDTVEKWREHLESLFTALKEFHIKDSKTL